MELSKSQKKIAREIIEKGLLREFGHNLSGAEKILTQWKAGEFNNRDAYHALYKHITDCDKHIARRHDGMTGSRYLPTIIDQLYDGVISKEDLTGFPEELQLWLTNSNN